VIWATSLVPLALYDAIARRLGLVATLVAGLAGALAGVLAAEQPWWWMVPFSWSVHASIPLTGTHANGIPLEAGSPLWQLSPWPAILMTAVLTVPAAWWAGRTLPGSWSRTRRARSRSGRDYSKAGSFRCSPLSAELTKARRTPLLWLTAVTPVLVALLGAWRHNPLAAWQGWTLLVLPFGCALGPTLAWQWEREAWRVLRSRPLPSWRLLLAKLGLLWLLAAVATMVLGLLLAAVGLPPGVLARLLPLALTLALMLLALQLWLCLRFGAAVSLAVGSVGTLLALVLGGSELGAHVWPFVPWTWGWVPAMTGREVLFTPLALLLAGGFFWLTLRADPFP
jgi:ABC-2 type transport system permease protein